MGFKEKTLINQLVLSCDKWSRLFRANSGLAWTGKVVEKTRDYIKIKNPRPFHGLPKGFSDLFGIESIIITNDMVGKRVAVFKAVEVKTGKVPITKEQQLFGDMVDKLGGIFEVIRG